MPYNRFFIDAPLTVNASVSFSDDQHHYFRKVLRGQSGETIEVINGKGALAHASVDSVCKDSFTATLQEVVQKAPAIFTLTIATAFLKPNHLEYALEKATELGATRFLLFEAERSEKKAVSAIYLKRLQAITIAATKQCGRLFLPEITVRNSMSDCFEPNRTHFFGDFGPQAKSVDGCTVTGHHTTIFIGPESGFSERERDILTQHATAISLHPNTLRAETAVIAATLLFFEKLDRGQLC